MPTKSITIIGGGVIGAATAYFLSKAGCKVTLVERGRLGSGCSHGNCGYVSPSHVLPLAEPGAVKRALKSMLSETSPFHIKPSFDPALWTWLLRFARRCNHRDMLESAAAIQALLNSSVTLYEHLIRDEQIDCDWQDLGMLFVFSTEAGFRQYSEVDRLLTDSFHCPATRYRGEQLAELEPALKPGLAGAFHYACDKHLRPDRLMNAWRDVLERHNVTLVENTTVGGFRIDQGAARAVETPNGDLEADEFVLATGAWSPLFATQLGCSIPIQPGKGLSLTMPRPAICPKYPMMFQEHRVGVTPFHDGYRLCSTMEFGGYDETINPRRLALLSEGAKHYLKEPTVEPIAETWYGWRPMTPDSRPIIGRSPALPNVMIAAGHNMLGLSMAPATGKLVSELLTGAQPHINPSPYAATRW
jgi:D-amino-acid dehydrogenase